MERLLLLGKDFQELGEVEERHLKSAVACLSAGSDADSPSMQHKGSKACINEDAIAVVRAESRWLFAVADGHHGHELSHQLIQEISEIRSVPNRLGQLSLFLAGQDLASSEAGGSALAIAVLDETSGAVFGFSFGDCSVVTIGTDGVRWRNAPNQLYLRAGQPIPVELASTFDFTLKNQEVLLLFSDGINECCYRNAHLSIQAGHLRQLHQELAGDVQALGKSLVNLALTGVDGNPGGQDNISVVAYARP
jgi:hypothetical protein